MTRLTIGWSTLVANEGNLELTPEKGNGTFITRNQLKLAGPATAKLTLKTSTTGPAAIAWRMSGDKGFDPTNRTTFQVAASDD